MWLSTATTTLVIRTQHAPQFAVSLTSYVLTCDLDYGLDNLISVAQRTNFPWLMSNVLDIETSRPLAEGKLLHIIDKAGVKVVVVTVNALLCSR